MLNLLHIENIAVIERAEIVFDRGLNVLTGETGAGKSIVIDAISAILGERTYRDLIRTGCTSASVSAVFSGVPENAWFADHQIPYDEAELLIQRDIYTDGRNLCRVNGRPVTVTILRELGRLLINIHGQNDSQSLFDEDTHLGYLDLISGDEAELAAYRYAYGRVAALESEIRRLSMDESEKLRREETLRYQLAEIERAALREGEDDELESRRRILQNAEKLSDGLEAATGELYGGEDDTGALDLISRAERELDRLSSVDGKFGEWSRAIAELRIGLQDVTEQIRDELSELSFSADELEKIESRLDVIRRLRKKYGATVGDILSFAEKAQQELDEIEYAGDRVEKLNGDLLAAKEDATALALKLRAVRQACAENLRVRIESELSQLDMPNIHFSCEFTPSELSVVGMDSVRFLMSANVGEAMKPLSKVASGGELARIMLAMKNVLAEKDSVGTMIFDEVDAGVSGRAAQKVAEKLLSVSGGKQVLCVTHLPQIAAIADSHLLVSKVVREGRTFTTVDRLERAGRIGEIARIIGGSDITETTRRSAEEMLR